MLPSLHLIHRQRCAVKYVAEHETEILIFICRIVELPVEGETISGRSIAFHHMLILVRHFKVDVAMPVRTAP